MVIDLLILFFLASLIPHFRESFKKGFKGLWMSVGVMLVIMNLVMIVFVYPKLSLLFQESNLNSGQNAYFYLFGGLLISVAIILLAIKAKQLIRSNLSFYALFAFLIALVYVNLTITINNIITPIYQLTNSYK